MLSVVKKSNQSAPAPRARGASACGAGRKSSRPACRPLRARDGTESEREVDWRRPPDLPLGWHLACVGHARSRHSWSFCPAGCGRLGATPPSGTQSRQVRALATAVAWSGRRNRPVARQRPGAKTGVPDRSPATHHGPARYLQASASSSEPPVHLRRLRAATVRLASRRQGKSEHRESDLSSACKQYMYHMRLLPSLAHCSMLSRSEPRRRSSSHERP